MLLRPLSLIRSVSHDNCSLLLMKQITSWNTLRIANNDQKLLPKQLSFGVSCHIVYQMRFHGITSDDWLLQKQKQSSVARSTSHQSVRSMQMPRRTTRFEFINSNHTTWMKYFISEETDGAAGRLCYRNPPHACRDSAITKLAGAKAERGMLNSKDEGTAGNNHRQVNRRQRPPHGIKHSNGRQALNESLVVC